MTTPWTLADGPGGVLRIYTTDRPSAGREGSAVVLCHDLPTGRESAQDVGRSYPALADRLAQECGRQVWTATFRGAGGSEGNFSAQGWLEDLAFVVDQAAALAARIWMAGFGLGGALGLCHSADDRRIAGVAYLGYPSQLMEIAQGPTSLLAACRANGLIRTRGFPTDQDAWVGQLRDLRSKSLEAAAHLSGRPLLMVQSSDGGAATATSETLAENGGAAAELRLIPGAGPRLRADPRAVATLMGWLERQA